jgi:DNA (cytosine-5)-methyltransferase 1
MTQLVLSLFPGIGLLDMAFEQEGFCVVRGPDLIWGGDVRGFHPPSGRFDGVIGGPPCQAFSPASGGTSKATNLIPEYERIVLEAMPDWFVMENVPRAPEPTITCFRVRSFVLNNRWFGAEQNRVRRFSIGANTWSGPHGFSFASLADGIAWEDKLLEPVAKSGCFTANGTQWEPGVDTKRGRMRGRSRSQRTRAEMQRGLRLQGLPVDHLDRAPFTVEGAIRAIGNGVPLPMGRAVARAVKRALGVTP